MITEPILEWRNPIFRALAFVFCSPFVFCFHALLVVRHFYYDHRRNPVVSRTKIIGIGSLSVGGTGKTPTTDFLARALVAHGYRVGVVSSGYRKKSSGSILVSDGHRILCDVYAAGDEAFLLAKTFVADSLGIAVSSGMDRRLAIELLESNGDLDFILLDDSFQYRQIHKTFEILVQDAYEGTSLNWLLPIGRLRDLKARSATANALIIHKSDLHEKINIAWAEDLPVTRASFQAMELKQFVVEQIAELRILEKKKLVVFSGLGHPKAWDHTIIKLARLYKCTIIANIHFRDHHWYSEIDLKSIFSLMRDDYTLLMTEKDAVKIMPEWIPKRFYSNVFVLKSKMTMDDVVLDRILKTL